MKTELKNQPGVERLMGFLGCWGAKPGRLETVEKLQVLAAGVYEIDVAPAPDMVEEIERLGPRERKLRAVKNFPSVFGQPARSGRVISAPPASAVAPGRDVISEIAAALNASRDEVFEALETAIEVIRGRGRFAGGASAPDQLSPPW